MVFGSLGLVHTYSPREFGIHLNVLCYKCKQSNQFQRQLVLRCCWLLGSTEYCTLYDKILFSWSSNSFDDFCPQIICVFFSDRWKKKWSAFMWSVPFNVAQCSSEIKTLKNVRLILSVPFFVLWMSNTLKEHTETSKQKTKSLRHAWLTKIVDMRHWFVEIA